MTTISQLNPYLKIAHVRTKLHHHFDKNAIRAAGLSPMQGQQFLTGTFLPSETQIDKLARVLRLHELLEQKEA